MTTAAFFVKKGLQLLLVQPSEAEIQPDEAQDFIDTMNMYMLALDGDGVHLGYTLIENLGDEVTVPPQTYMGVITNSALLAAPEYGKQPSGTLVAAAQFGERIMRKIGQPTPKSFYPSTLPIGSGNEGDYTFSNYHFYPDLQAEILAETSGSIGLESSTGVLS